MSFIEKARRAQIVKCAIETIAEVGYAQAWQSYIAPRIEAQKSPKAMLRVYIESNFAFVAENRQHVFVVIELVKIFDYR